MGHPGPPRHRMSRTGKEDEISTGFYVSLWYVLILFGAALLDTGTKFSRWTDTCRYGPLRYDTWCRGMTRGDIDLHGTLSRTVYENEQCHLLKELRKSAFHDEEYAKKNFTDEERAKYLALPLFDEGCSRIVYEVIEYENLMDSSNMAMSEWSIIAGDILKYYERYDGFVVLHGTDTMAYTASALSFMCEHLGKPIVLTGSQIPIFEVRTDGRDNFLNSLITAGNYKIPEVMICFNNKLFRGNRTTKIDPGSFNGFDSPKHAPLVTMEIPITVDWFNIPLCNGDEKFHIQSALCPNVGVLHLYPGITAETVRSFMKSLKGVVLETYGVGNAPTNVPGFLQAITDATEAGVIVVNVTQCLKGFVIATYANGQVLEDAGVLPGNDLTTEAALTKLSYILAKDDCSLEEKKMMMEKNLRGEMIDNEMMKKNLRGEMIEISSNEAVSSGAAQEDAFRKTLALNAERNAKNKMETDNAILYNRNNSNNPIKNSDQNR